jgi:SH3-like domain-containing protein
MHCYKHNFEYEFLGVCRYCEAEEAEKAAQRRFEEQQEQQERLAEEQQELQERRADEQREQQEELERQQNERHEELLAQIAEARYRAEQRDYERQQREEEQLARFEAQQERARIAHEQSLERDRQARIDHAIAANLHASARHLASGNAAAALEDAGRALDQSPAHIGAVEAAYRAAKALNRRTEALGYLRTLTLSHVASIDDAPSWSLSLGSRSRWLLAEAFEAGPNGIDLVQRLMGTYRGSPQTMKAMLLAANEPALYSKWLDHRLTHYAPHQGDFKLIDLLNEALGTSDPSLGPSQLVKKVGSYGEFLTNFVEWLCDRGLYDEALDYLRAATERAVASDRIASRIPMAIEVCRRATRPPDDWVRLLEADLAKFDAAQLDDRPLQSAWLSDDTKHTYVSLAGARSGYRHSFAQWLLSHEHGREANRYLWNCFTSESTSNRIQMIPQGIQACQQVGLPTTNWEDLLVEELRSISLEQTRSYAVTWGEESPATKLVLGAAMVRHLKRIATCQPTDMTAAGLPVTVDVQHSRSTVFDSVTGNERTRIITIANPLLVGIPMGALWWVYSRDGWTSIQLGLVATLVFWAVRAWYLSRTTIVRRSIVGRYLREYQALLSSLGIEESRLAHSRELLAVRPSRELFGALAVTGLIVALLWAVSIVGDFRLKPPAIFDMTAISGKALSGPAYITGDDVNVRTQPSKSARAVDSLSRGAPVEILDSSDGWHLVRRVGERKALGWVFGTYVSENAPAQAATPLLADSGAQADAAAGSALTGTDFAGDAARSTPQMVPSATVVSAGRCPFEGCQLGTWVATNAIPLRAERGGPISGTMIYLGQSVQALESEVWAMPKYGKVLEAGPYEQRRGIQPGAEVYVLHPLGEGAMAVWYQGEIIDGSLDLRVDLQEEPEWSWWVRVATEDGRSGWLKDPQGNFEGMTSH